MKTVLLCLHGWGGSKESFTELREALKGSDLEILTPDLPGFGQEPEPKHPWTTDDYADWVVDWYKKTGHQHSRLFLLGHSHGGRIALKLATRLSRAPNSEPEPALPIAHLFLCAPAGIRHPRHFKRIVGLMLAKTGKFFLSIPGIRKLQPLGKQLLYKLVRVHDYEKASPIMRETMIRVSAEDLRGVLPLITVPTDIFWGTDDRMTPIGDLAVLQRGIVQSRKHVFPGVRHNVHRAAAKDIATTIRKNI